MRHYSQHSSSSLTMLMYILLGVCLMLVCPCWGSCDGPVGKDRCSYDEAETGGPFRNGLNVCLERIQNRMDCIDEWRKEGVSRIRGKLEENVLRKVLAAMRPNIRQCSAKFSQEADDGEVQTCQFTKKAADTTLRLVWNGSLRVMTSNVSVACSRWFLTLNNKECQSPATIDTQITEANGGNNIIRPAYLEGFCNDVPGCVVDVTLNVGSCDGWTEAEGDAHTGWGATSRIIVEELDVQEPALID